MGVVARHSDKLKRLARLLRRAKNRPQLLGGGWAVGSARTGRGLTAEHNSNSSAFPQFLGKVIIAAAGPHSGSSLDTSPGSRLSSSNILCCFQ